MYKLYGQKVNSNFKKLSSLTGASLLVSQLLIMAAFSLNTLQSRVNAYPGYDGTFEDTEWSPYQVAIKFTAYDFEPDVTGPSISEKNPDDNDVIGGTHTIRVKVTDPSGVNPDSVYARFKDGSTDVKTYYLEREGTTDYFSKTVNTKEFESRIKTYSRVSYRAVDLNGNARSSVADDVTVDNSGPTISNKTPAENTTIGGIVLVRINVNDISGVKDDSVYVRFRNASGAESTFYLTRDGTTSYFSRTIDTTTFVPRGTTSGPSRVSFRAIDGLGNPRSSVSDGVTIDNKAPSINSIVYKQDSNNVEVLSGGFTNSELFTFDLRPSGDAVRYQLKYWNDIPASPFKEASPWSPSNLMAGGFMSENGVYSDRFSQGDGVHYFSFSACDALDNCSEYTTPFQVAYDSIAPVLGFDNVTTSDTTPELLGDSGDAVIVTVDINGVGSLATVTAGTWQTEVLFPLAAGTYDVTVTGTDAAGNQTVEIFEDGLTITPPSQVQGDNTENNPPVRVGTPTVITTTASANRSNNQGGIGGNNFAGNGNGVLGATDVAQADESAETESTDDDSQVLQSTIDSTNDGDVTTDGANNNDGCFELFGICWYWYAIPAIALIGFGFYWVSKEDK